MKTLLLFLAATGLSGCAIYRAPADATGVRPAIVHPPPFIFAGSVYPSGYYAIPYAYPYARAYASALRPLHPAGDPAPKP